jgi:hypothetical protein
MTGRQPHLLTSVCQQRRCRYDRRAEDLLVQICALRNCFHEVRVRSPVALAVRRLALHSFMVSTLASAATARPSTARKVSPPPLGRSQEALRVTNLAAVPYSGEVLRPTKGNPLQPAPHKLLSRHVPNSSNDPCDRNLQSFHMLGPYGPMTCCLIEPHPVWTEVSHQRGMQQ